MKRLVLFMAVVVLLSMSGLYQIGTLSLQMGSADAASIWVPVKSENFDDTFPNDWVLAGNYSSVGTPITWGAATYFPSSAPKSGWPHASVYNPSTNLLQVATAGNPMVSTMTYGPFSLVGATDARMTFKVAYELGAGDSLSYYASKDGVTFKGATITGGINFSWTTITLDLKAVPTPVGNLCGQSQVWVRFSCTADAVQSNSAGPFIDDILVEKFVTPPSAPTGLDLAAADDTGSLSTDNITMNTSALTITGTAPAGTNVQLFDNGVATGSVTTAAAFLSTGINISLIEGVHAITAKATDTNGTSDASTSLNITVDTTAPSSPTGLDLQTADDTGLNTDNITKNTSALTIKGTAPGTGITVQLYDDGVATGISVTAAIFYTTGAGVDISLPEGTHAITAKGTDTAGNVSNASIALSITVDATAPTVSIGAPSTPTTKSGPVTYTITYTGATAVTLADANVTLNKTGTANGTAVVSGTGTATRTVTISSITGTGTLGISIAASTASDTAANSALAAGPSTTFTVDNTAPTITIGSPSASLTKSGPVTYTITYVGADTVTLANANVTLNKTGTANGSAVVSGTGTATRTVTISSITGDGTLGISIAAGTASDNLGNTALAAGPSTTFTVDNTAPTISIGAPSVSTTTSDPVTYTVTYGGANTVTLANANITLNKTGTANGTAVVSGTGTATRTVTISSITGSGTLGISIAAGTATDTAGNSALGAGPSTTFTVSQSSTYTLTCTVNLLNFSGDVTTIPVVVELNGIPMTLNLDVDSKFTILDVAPDTYDVRIKASHWLAKFSGGVVVAGNTIMDAVTLTNGDVEDNNEVDFTDINATRAAYGSFPGDETWNERADVDGSLEVDFTDINIVRGNYGEIGD